jgi:hypothetical protein
MASKMIAGRPNTQRKVQAAYSSYSTNEAEKFWIVKNSNNNPITPVSHSYHLTTILLPRSHRANVTKAAPIIKPIISHIACVTSYFSN